MHYHWLIIPQIIYMHLETFKIKMRPKNLLKFSLIVAKPISFLLLKKILIVNSNVIILCGLTYFSESNFVKIFKKIKSHPIALANRQQDKLFQKKYKFKTIVINFINLYIF